MKTKLQTVCAASLAVALLLSIGATIVQAETVGYWRFEGAGYLEDSGPYNLDVTPYTGGTGPSQYTLPATGPGSDFPDPVPQNGYANDYGVGPLTNTSDGYTGADNSVLHFTEGFTIECFFHRTYSYTTHRTVYRQFGVNNMDERSVMFTLAKGDSLYRNSLEIRFSTDGEDWPYVRSYFVDSDLAYEDDKDYYGAVSVDLVNQTLTFYLKNLTDGGELLSATTTCPVSSLHDSSDNFYLGVYHSSTAYSSYPDYLDEIRVSNAALGEADLLINQIPEPSTLALLAAGLIGLMAYAWRKRK